MIDEIMQNIKVNKIVGSQEYCCIKKEETQQLLNCITKLQSNWDSLKELLINEKKLIEEDEFFCTLSNKDYIEFILDKMNELEGKDKNE